MVALLSCFNRIKLSVMIRHNPPPDNESGILEKDLAYAEYKTRHAGDLDADLSDWTYNLSRLVAAKKKPKVKTSGRHNPPKDKSEIPAAEKKYHIVFHPHNHKDHEWRWDTEEFASPEEAFEYAMKHHPIDGFRVVKLIYPKDS